MIGRGDRYSPDGPSRLQTNSIICAHNFHYGSSVFIEQEIYMQNTHKIVSLFFTFSSSSSSSFHFLSYFVFIIYEHEVATK